MQLIYPTIPTYKGSPVFRYFININNHVGFMIKSRKKTFQGPQSVSWFGLTESLILGLILL